MQTRCFFGLKSVCTIYFFCARVSSTVVLLRKDFGSHVGCFNGKNDSHLLECDGESRSGTKPVHSEDACEDSPRRVLSIVACASMKRPACARLSEICARCHNSVVCFR